MRFTAPTYLSELSTAENEGFSGIIPPMSSAVATPPRLNRPNIVAVGTIVWLSSELMFFAALFAMYFTTRAVQGPCLLYTSDAADD